MCFLTAAANAMTTATRTRICRTAWMMALLMALAWHWSTVGAERAIYEDVGELVGSTSYLHVHVDIPLKAVEKQLKEYEEWLHDLTNKTYVVALLTSSPKTDVAVNPWYDHHGYPGVRVLIAEAWIQLATDHLVTVKAMKLKIEALRGVFPLVDRNTTVRARYAN